MRFLGLLAALWIVLSAWLAFKPRESAAQPRLSWTESKASLSFSGRWLAVDVDPTALGSFGQGRGADWEILVWDRENGEVSRFSTPGVSYRGPRLDRQGEQVVFEASPGPDFMSDVHLAKTKSMTSHRVPTPWRQPGHGSAFAPNLSASGDVLSFLTSRPKAASHVWEKAMALGTPKDAQLAFPEGTGSASSMVALSPNGQRAVWERRDSEEDRDQVRLMVSELGNPPAVLDTPGWEPSLSSGECVYVKPDEGGIYQIFLHHFASGTREALTDGNDDSFEPCLSEDGNFLVFTSYAKDLVQNDDNEASDIFFLDLESSELRSLTQGGDGNSYAPALSGDGSTVAFSSLATNLGREPVARGQVYLWERDWSQCQVVNPRDPSSTLAPE